MSDVFNFPNLELAPNGCVAPPDIAELTQEQLNKISNGCGPSGAKLDLVPDKLLGKVDLYNTCSIHDCTYNFGETEQDKQWGDIILLVNALLEINKTFPGDNIGQTALRYASRKLAFEYYLAVAGWGHDAFWAGKDHE